MSSYRTHPPSTRAVTRPVALAGALLAVALATVALLAAGLSGCGAGDGASDGQRLRLGYFPNITHAPTLVGVREGIFARNLGAVTLETTPFNAGPSAIEALFNGSLDATYIGPNPAINGWAQSKGTALRIVAGTTSGGAGLVVQPSVATVADLRGKILATPQLGNTQDVAARFWLKSQGFTVDQAGGGDVSVRPIPNAEIVTGFASGSIDAAWVPEPHLSRLVEEHRGRLFLDEKQEWPGGEFVTTHLVVRAEFLTEHPDIVRDLLKGHLEAVSRTVDQPAQAQAAANAQLAALTGKPLPEGVVAAAFANLTFTVDPVASSLAGSAEHAVAVGLLDEVDLTGIYALDPLNALLRDAGRPEVSAGRLAS